MKNTLIILVFLIISFIGFSQKGKQQKIELIIEKLGMDETQKFMLFDLKINQIKGYASGADSLRLLEIEAELTDEEIRKRVGVALDSFYTKKEINDLHKFIKTSAFNKLLMSDKLQDLLDDQFTEINEELENIALNRPKIKKNTIRSFEPIEVDREDGFYGTIDYYPENNGKIKLTESPALTFKHIYNVTKETSDYDFPEILIELTEEGKELFTLLTSENIGKHIAIVIDKQIISLPMVMSVISYGKVSISGNFSDEELDQIIEKLMER